MTTHLSEEEFSALFIGDTETPRVSAHLSECQQCRGEVEALRGATADFNRLGDRWAQHESSDTLQVAARQEVRPTRLPLFALPVGGALAACLLLIALVLHTGSAHLRSAARIGAPSAAEIAQDNRWLKAMDQDLQSGPDAIVIPASEVKALQQP